jgi:FHA domain
VPRFGSVPGEVDIEMLTQARTETDPGGGRWDREEEVIQLREWGTLRVHSLPKAPPSPILGEWFLGTSSDCYLRFCDATGRMSRRHARLLREPMGWSLLDIGSKNGMYVDGARQVTAVLEAGTEITLGGVTLVAESRKWIAARGFLARLLGWGPERLSTVDAALRAVRVAHLRNSPLILRGEGDLVGVAKDLHRRFLGAEAPFVLCTPRGPSVDSNLAGISKIDRGLDAIAAAGGGTVCVRSRRPPADFIKVVAALRSPAVKALLIVCDDARADATSLLSLPITVPGLAARYDELPRIIDEYTRDAAQVFGCRIDGFAEIRGWILEQGFATISDVERAAYRLFALRVGGTIDGAARLLGLDVGALRRWLHHTGASSVATGGSRLTWNLAGAAANDAT